MTDSQTITMADVRALLDAGSDEATLGLIEGRVELISPDQLGTEQYRGALEVISRGELLQRLGDDRDDAALEAQAAGLTTAVHQIGG
ncbi:MAG: hypothetical protein JWP31_1133 [Aeromicrobium sp.]|nr:hypothetical protein [Aeromicrobium sp.]